MSNLRLLKSIFPDHKLSSGRWMNIRCPFCQNHGMNPDKGYHLGINYIQGYTNCFRCKSNYKLDYFLKITNKSYNQEDLSFESKLESNNYSLEFPKEFINLNNMLKSKYSEFDDALAYIDKRVGIDLAIQLNIGFCNIGKYANRIIVPMFNTSDEIIYFVARSIYSFIKPKILNPYGDRRSILFNWNKARNFSEIYLTEGVFGSLIMYPYGVATLGKKVTEEQILTILKSDVKIINICLDGNAIKESYEVANKILSLTSKIKVRVLELGEQYQPDDFDLNFFFKLKNNTPFYRGIFQQWM